MCSDGIAGFKGSLERVFPRTQSQRCVVHLVRTIYSLCPKKDAKEIIAVYKILFLRIRELSEKWNKPIKNWKTIREQLISLFEDRFLKYIKL